MDYADYTRLQATALAEVEALTRQLERGEITQADAEARIVAVMQPLERDTAGFLPQLRRRNRWLRLVPWLLPAALALAIVVRGLLH